MKIITFIIELLCGFFALMMLIKYKKEQKFKILIIGFIITIPIFVIEYWNSPSRHYNDPTYYEMIADDIKEYRNPYYDFNIIEYDVRILKEKGQYCTYVLVDYTFEYDYLPGRYSSATFKARLDDDNKPIRSSREHYGF